MADIPMPRSEPHLNELRETVERVRELFVKCRDACPESEADPVVVARWEGAFMTLRALLVEELNPLLESWENDDCQWRSTEKMLGRE